MYLPAALLFFATFGSGLLVFVFPYLPKNPFRLILAFGGSFLFSLTLVHLIPDLFKEYAERVPHGAIGKCLLVGFLLQVFLDTVGGSVAHGHGAEPSCSAHLGTALSLLCSLCIHSIVEGVALGLNYGTHYGSVLLLGIVLHKMPAAIVLATVLYNQIKDKYRICLFLALFALATPIAAAMGYYLQGYCKGNEPLLGILGALATGSLLHIATTILFELAPHHRISLAKWIAILLGVGTALLASATHSCH